MRPTICPQLKHWIGERGSALLPVTLLMFLLAAVSIGIAVVVRIEVTVARRFVDTTQAFHAADAAIAVALSELRALPAWTPVLAGASWSLRADGAYGGTKSVPGGGSVLICCGAGSAADRLARETAGSPAVARRALRWQPFLWMPFSSLVGDVPPSRIYLAVFVQDDEDDGDGNGAIDANGRVVVRAEALQPDGLRRSIEALVEREPGDPLRGLAPAVRVLRWREVR